MQQLRFGTPPQTVPLLAVQRLPAAESAATAFVLGLSDLLAHPLVDRDKLLFTSDGDHYVGFLARMDQLASLLTEVEHEGRPAPVVSPLLPVGWQAEGASRPAEIRLLIGLKQKEGAPDTFADRPRLKPAGPVWKTAVAWCLLVFGGTLAATVALSLAYGEQAAYGGGAALVTGLLVWSLLQGRWGPAVRAPDLTRPSEARFWDGVRELALRQLRASALPGEWTVAAIPRGERHGVDWALPVALSAALVAGLLTFWALA